MTREQFEASLVKAPDPGTAGEVLFDFRSVPRAPRPQFRYNTVIDWSEDGQALEECWQAYLREEEADWTD